MRPIYSIAMNEARCGAVCHRKFVPVLKIGGKCSCLRAKPAHIPGHLPAPSRLKSAAELLVLRHDTLKLIDGAGPTTLAQDQTSAEEPGVNGKEPERQTAPEKEQQNTTKTVEPAKEQVQTNTSPNCTFSGEQVPIDLKRFTDSGINLVECPRCGRMRSLSPAFGRPPVQSTHPSAGQQTPLTEKRWSATGKTDWSVVEG